MSNSVSDWITAVRDGDERAATQLWDRYFHRLAAIANRRLGPSGRRVSDGDDIGLSVMESLFDGLEQGRFEKLAGRQDLWRLLVAITARKAVDQVRRIMSAKHGGGAVRGDSIFDGSVANFGSFPDGNPTPDEVAAIEEEKCRLFSKLDETMQHIAQGRLAGSSNAEIAETLNVSERTVERKLNMIRQRWSEELGIA